MEAPVRRVPAEEMHGKRAAPAGSREQQATEAERPGEVRARLPSHARALVAHIGNTPLLPLPSPNRAVRILGKAEWFNPGGSVKDRPAWWIVREALSSGYLPQRALLDASSGNTAIAYAMLGAAIGFSVTICVPANANPERKKTLKAYGATLVETNGLEGSDGAILRARELAEEEPARFWYADQYANAANPRAHEATTAAEIWDQTGGEVTHFVAGLGTTGTLVGASRRLRRVRPDIRIVGVEPAGPLHGIEGLKHLDTALRPAIWNESAVDRREQVRTEDAQAAARRLARDAGLLVGVSSGAVYAACRRLVREMDSGMVVTVLPDGGSRYLSEGWWAES